MIIHPHIPKRKKRKPTAKQRQLAAEWEAICKKYETKKKLSGHVTSSLLAPKVYIRDTGPKINSLPFSGAPCTKPIEGKRYTGSAMLGIGTLHKSNAVPIFSNEEAKEQARMRRG